jgi:hypothetical protein
MYDAPSLPQAGEGFFLTYMVSAPSVLPDLFAVRIGVSGTCEALMAHDQSPLSRGRERGLWGVRVFLAYAAAHASLVST